MILRVIFFFDIIFFVNNRMDNWDFDFKFSCNSSFFNLLILLNFVGIVFFCDKRGWWCYVYVLNI